jgi:hypothetical protein
MFQRGMKCQKYSTLRIHDLAEAEASRHDHYSDQREPERNFVADHLGAGAQSTEQRILYYWTTTRRALRHTLPSK